MSPPSTDDDGSTRSVPPSLPHRRASSASTRSVSTSTTTTNTSMTGSRRTPSFIARAAHASAALPSVTISTSTATVTASRPMLDSPLATLPEKSRTGTSSSSSSRSLASTAHMKHALERDDVAAAQVRARVERELAKKAATSKGKGKAVAVISEFGGEGGGEEGMFLPRRRSALYHQTQQFVEEPAAAASSVALPLGEVDRRSSPPLVLPSSSEDSPSPAPIIETSRPVAKPPPPLVVEGPEHKPEPEPEKLTTLRPKKTPATGGRERPATWFGAWSAPLSAPPSLVPTASDFPAVPKVEGGSKASTCAAAGFPFEDQQATTEDASLIPPTTVEVSQPPARAVATPAVDHAPSLSTIAAASDATPSLPEDVNPSSPSPAPVAPRPADSSQPSHPSFAPGANGGASSYFPLTAATTWLRKLPLSPATPRLVYDGEVISSVTSPMEILEVTTPSLEAQAQVHPQAPPAPLISEESGATAVKMEQEEGKTSRSRTQESASQSPTVARSNKRDSWFSSLARLSASPVAATLSSTAAPSPTVSPSLESLHKDQPAPAAQTSLPSAAASSPSPASELPEPSPAVAPEPILPPRSWLLKTPSLSTLRSSATASTSPEPATPTPTAAAIEAVSQSIPALSNSYTPTPPPQSSASMGWFGRGGKEVSASSPTAFVDPSSNPATAVSSAPSAPFHPTPSSSIPISKTAVPSSPPSTKSPASSYSSSSRPKISSSLGREVLVSPVPAPEAHAADSNGEDAMTEGGKPTPSAQLQQLPAGSSGSSWWGYVPLIGSGQGSDALQVVMASSNVQPILEEPAHEPEPTPEPPVTTMEEPTSAPPPSTVSYLNPISWVWPVSTATESAPPSAQNAAPVPAPEQQKPAGLPEVPTAASEVSPAGPTSAGAGLPSEPPTTYSSWLGGYFSSRASQSDASLPVPESTTTSAAPVEDFTAPSSSPTPVPSSSPAIAVPIVAAITKTPSLKSFKTPSLSSFSLSGTSVPKDTVDASLSSSHATQAPFTANSKLKAQTPRSSSAPLTSTSATSTSARPSSKTTLPPNFVLPTYKDVFNHEPRSVPPPRPKSVTRKTLSALGSYVLPEVRTEREMGVEERRQRARELPKTFDVIRGSGFAVSGGDSFERPIRRVVIIGVHGWFPNAIVRYIAGEPTGTSTAFSNKMRHAVETYFQADGRVELDKITVMSLEGEGKVEDRVDKLFKEYLSRADWVDDMRLADAVLIATHSQGCPVTVHLLNRLYEQGHLCSPHNAEAVDRLEAAFGPPSAGPRRRGRRGPKVAMLGLCGVHLGPLAYLNSSYVAMPFIQYFENAAAHELFEFQDTESACSKAYIASLSSALDHGAKFVFVASLNDQVVPVYSAIFSAAHHPSILRLLHIDGAAYDALDFVTNLLIFCLQLRNAGLSDGGLVAHLSEAVASGLTGVGHSTAYGEDASYYFAVRYALETSDANAPRDSLEVEEFLATEGKNSYEIPWILRGIMEDPLVLELFSTELTELRNGFELWEPKEAKMKDLRRKLEPLRPRQSRRAAPSSSAAAPSPMDKPSPFGRPVTPNPKL